jgi:septal ring factor EnvC (AmiA/AmiB activator)
MTELETNLLRIIEEQQQQLLQQQAQLQEQQKTLDSSLSRIVKILEAQAETIKTDQENLVQMQKSLATMQKQFHELERSTASYTEQINGKVREMSQITANNEEVLERISTTQRLVSSEVAKAQQNLLETSEILKKISSR